MHKKLHLIIATLIFLSFLTLPALAQSPHNPTGPPDFAGKPEPTGEPQPNGKPDFAGKTGQAGKSNIAHLYLYEKTGDPDWDIVENGAWGKMKYNPTGPEFDFVFNGHGLEVGSNYTLIYYPDPFLRSKSCQMSPETKYSQKVHQNDNPIKI